ncbi:MAG: hypothetical protein R2752_16940 [Vicinamibacterales bacterium]
MIRTRHLALAALFATVAVSTASAQTAATPPRRTSTRPPAASTQKTATPAPTPLQASGVLTKWDDKAGMITVKTDKGDVMFPIALTTRLEQNRRTIAQSALAGDVNHDVRVRYTEQNGVKTVLSVTVGAVAKPGKQ